MSSQSNLSKLADIMPDISIDFNGLYCSMVLASICLVAVVVVSLGIRKSKQTLNIKDDALKRLKSMDFNGVVTRQMLYDFTLDTKSCPKTEGSKLEELEQKLLKYKYHNQDINLPRELVLEIVEYIEELS